MKAFLRTLFAVLCLSSSAWAVATVTTSGSTSTTTYKTTEPTTIGSGPNRTSWTSGWETSSSTGWDYVGTIQLGSTLYGGAVYLGDGWVITAAHVVSVTDYSKSFTLSGTTYTIVAGSIQQLGSADLVMFQISSTIDLPALTLASSVSTNSTVVMVGYGGGSESWGASTVHSTDVPISLLGYNSTDFVATSGSTHLVVGDSGGAGFIYNSTTKQWELAGILEATATGTSGSTVTYYSYLIDLSTYADQISTVMSTAVPEPESWALAGAGGTLLLWFRRRYSAFRKKKIPPSIKV